MQDISGEYFDWLLSYVSTGGFDAPAYKKLLTALHGAEFIYILDMDENRADDGIDLRYRFAYERGISMNEARAHLDGRPCSVLEMMVALAIRCEEQIMSDPDAGDRTGRWFMDMMRSLGLERMTDAHFDKRKLDYILARLMSREYEPCGLGGLFTISDPVYDMRDIEIWYQMMLYLEEDVDVR